MQKEIKKIYIIPNDNNLILYKKNSFILPLKDFSIGFDEYYDINEINEYAKIFDISVIINKFMHKDEIRNLEIIIKKLENIKYFFIEDFGLTSIIDKEKIVLYPIHKICNYESINYLKELGYENVVLTNELTIDEIQEIISTTQSNLFYFYVNKNNLMYSKRSLITNYYKNYDIKSNELDLLVSEVVSKKKLLVKEENGSTTIFYDNIFCASKYLKELNNMNLIVNFNNIDKEQKELILNNLDSEDLCKLINSDYRFLEEKIIYKVGD